VSKFQRISSWLTLDKAFGLSFFLFPVPSSAFTVILGSFRESRFFVLKNDGHQFHNFCANATLKDRWRCQKHLILTEQQMNITSNLNQKAADVRVRSRSPTMNLPDVGNWIKSSSEDKLVLQTLYVSYLNLKSSPKLRLSLFSENFCPL
jgi:hypothetical protein